MFQLHEFLVPTTFRHTSDICVSSRKEEMAKKTLLLDTLSTNTATFLASDRMRWSHNLLSAF